MFIPKAKTVNENTHSMRDVLPYWPEWVVIGVFMLFWFCLTFLYPVPGCPRGYLGAGGSTDYGKYSNCTGGASGYFDNIIFGDHKGFYPEYGKSFDPEGTLGCITSITLCYLGLQAGKIIIHFNDHSARMVRWFLWGVGTGVLGTILCYASKDGGWIPICKNLWSLSFILVTGSLGFMILFVCYYLIDVKQVWSGAPFSFVGMNSIIIYFGHEILGDHFPFSTQAPNTHASQLAQNLGGVVSWFIVAYYMYLQNFFVSM